MGETTCNQHQAPLLRNPPPHSGRLIPWPIPWLMTGRLRSFESTTSFTLLMNSINGLSWTIAVILDASETLD